MRYCDKKKSGGFRVKKKKDIRWVQRLDNYCKALDTLKNDLEYLEKTPVQDGQLREMLQKSVVKSFEYTQEMAWNAVKDFYHASERELLPGGKSAFRMALDKGLVSDECLMDTLDSRNETVHAYNRESSDKIFHLVKDHYYHAFENLRKALLKEKEKRGL